MFVRMVARVAPAALLLAQLAVTGCAPPNAQATAAAGAMPAPPPPEVEVARVTLQPTIDYREFVGRTAASSAVEVRARVSGYLRQSPRSTASRSVDRTATYAPDGVQGAADEHNADLRNSDAAAADTVTVTCHEGTYVKKGTLLFEIDPSPYKLALAQAQGSLAAAEARLKRFELDLVRVKELLTTNTVSQANYDQAVASHAETLGQITSLRAAENRAKLDLEYTRVVAPIDGLLGRAMVTNGNLINSDSTVLTTIVATSPIYVDFSVDENSLLEYRARVRSGTVKNARESQVGLRLGLANEEGYPHEGLIDFVDNTTDPDTGNTRLRGTFLNEDGALSPGLFARVQSPFSAEYQAVMVPTPAIAMDQQGQYVLVVEDGKALRRSIELGNIQGPMVVVSKGVKEGETVITNGLQKVRPGSPVRIVPAAGAAPTVPAGSTADSASRGVGPSDPVKTPAPTSSAGTSSGASKPTETARP